MLDCNTDDNKQLLYSCLLDEWMLCSVITRVKEDTWVLKSEPFFSTFFSILFIVFPGYYPGCRGSLCPHFMQERMIPGLFLSAFLNLSSRGLHVIGPHGSFSFTVFLEDGADWHTCSTLKRKLLTLTVAWSWVNIVVGVIFFQSVSFLLTHGSLLIGATGIVHSRHRTAFCCSEGIRSDHLRVLHRGTWNLKSWCSFLFFSGWSPCLQYFYGTAWQKIFLPEAVECLLL